MANAAHFETELFHAALLRKSVQVFVSRGFEPDSTLREILRVLQASIDPNRWTEDLSDDEILSRVEKLVEVNRPFSPRRLCGSIAALLLDVRGGPVRTDGPLTEFFAGDSLADERSTPNLELVDNVKETLRANLPQRRRLSRIYVALREVMTRPMSDPALLQERNFLLGEWGRAASWYGLHAHVRSGVLAAAQSMALVRERLRASSATNVSKEDLLYPGGQLGSALYSISKHLRGERKVQTLREALEHLEKARRGTIENPENLLAIRGSVFRQLGLLNEAVRDYEQVLDVRQSRDMGPLKIGDAMAELGFGYFRQRRIRKGLDYLERGVQFMRQEAPSGFLIRGVKKLAVVRAVNGQALKAWRAWTEARGLARQTDMYDQL